MLKIKKQAQSIYAFKETGGEVLNFQIEEDCLKLFSGLLDDTILETLIDVQSISCNNKTIRILCYEENDDDFTLDYDLISKKVQNKVVLDYTVSGLLSVREDFYARYRNRIYKVDESMEIKEEIIIDKKVYDEASSISNGYSEVVLESENEFNIIQLSKL
ncbi:hypothetical protein FH003_11820 [Listeria monocytogenes]|nr:hypothetical protein [Listeria monocytogenes]